MKRSANEKFVNEGHGWICVRCAEVHDSDRHSHSRLLAEGEAENRELSTKALARWADPAFTILECPGCGTKDSAS